MMSIDTVSIPYEKDWFYNIQDVHAGVKYDTMVSLHTLRAKLDLFTCLNLVTYFVNSLKSCYAKYYLKAIVLLNIKC